MPRAGVIIVWCLAGELDAEAPAVGEPDDEHRLGDPGVLHRGDRPAPQGGLETPSQLLPPVWRGDVQETLDALAGRLSARSLQITRNCLERAIPHAEVRDGCHSH